MSVTSTTTPPESLDLLRRAAELRAAGTSWDTAAAQLTLGHDELRRLVADHNRDYERLVRRARTDVLRETLDEALAALRTHLDSRDERVSMSAATTLVRYDLARAHLGAQEARLRLERRARKLRDESMSESAEVPKQQKVDTPKNGAQTAAPKPPASAPATPARHRAGDARHQRSRDPDPAGGRPGCPAGRREASAR